MTPDLTRYSYRDDPAVPPFDDRRTLFVFDGICVLCSRGASFLMRHDRHDRLRFVSAQSPLGRALYAHFGLPIDESYLLIDDGMLHTKSAGYLRLAKVLGGRWRWLRVTRIVPRVIRDAMYDVLARHRYRWFGTAQQCALLTAEQRRRLIDGDVLQGGR